MAIISTPPFDINSIYRPVEYEFSIINSPFAPITYAIIEVRISGFLIATKLQPPNRIQGTQALFNVDISKDLQRNLGTDYSDDAPDLPINTIFPTTFNQSLVVDNFRNVRGDIVLNITYYGLNVQNLPIEITTESTDPITASIAIRQITDDPSLDEYIQDGINLKKALTRRPGGILQDPNASERTTLTETQDLSLSFYDDGSINTFQIDAKNKKTSVGLFYADLSALTQFAIQKTVSVGLQSLQGLNYLTTSFAGVEVDQYGITFGDFRNPNIFTPLTETYWFDIVCAKPDSLNVIWMNDLGGGESYTFQAEVIQTLKTKGTYAKNTLSPLAGFSSIKFLSSRFKQNNVENLVQYQCKSKNLDSNEAEYIKSLLYTVECYIEIDGKYYQAQVEDATFDVDINNKHFTVLEILLTRSVDQISMIR